MLEILVELFCVLLFYSSLNCVLEILVVLKGVFPLLPIDLNCIGMHENQFSEYGFCEDAIWM